MIFFTSDTHFFHRNIIKYDNAPFDSIEERDETIVKNWNEVVRPEDTIYHLGDVALRARTDKLKWFLYRLNGNICLIRGNHDQKIDRLKERFAWIKDSYILRLKNEKGHIVQWIHLCHYAMRTWYKSHWGSFHCFGHSHGNLSDNHTLSLDVGICNHNYYPISLDSVLTIMRTKSLNPLTKPQQKRIKIDATTTLLPK